MLDLGCEPGVLAAAFAPYAREVIGMDPEPNMLTAARDYAARLGQKVTRVAGSSYDLIPFIKNNRYIVRLRSVYRNGEVAVSDQREDAFGILPIGSQCFV
ncbi:MAG: class I SAM-dependent methyltransferase [Chthoniobacteraceae bacterium]